MGPLTPHAAFSRGIALTLVGGERSKSHARVEMSPDSTTSIASPNMSATTKELIARVRQMVPPMLERFHKGGCLFVALVGGLPWRDS